MLRQLVSGSLITAAVSGALVAVVVLACASRETSEGAADSSPSAVSASRTADDERPISALLVAPTLSSGEIAKLADWFAVSAYRMLPALRIEVLDASEGALNVVGAAVLADGEARHFGDTLDTGDQTQRAAFINTSTQDVELLVLRDNAGNADLFVPVTIAPNTMFVVGDIYDRGEDGRDGFNSPIMAYTDCQVKCGDGYFAGCAYGEDGLPSCSCISESDPQAYPAGGPGASYCSISQGASSHACEARCVEGFYTCCNWGQGGQPTCQCVEIPVGDCDSGGEGAIRCRLTQDLPDDPGEV